ncbi:MAG: lytic transglycosylase domain-containing protein [Sulfuriferula sp.]|nr:lytic transglycosylase domain-containing protein [Sulfuriferula sp.]
MTFNLFRSGWLLLALCAAVGNAQAGNQLYEPMSASVRASLSKAVSDTPVTNVSFLNNAEGQAWLVEMSKRLAKRMPDPEQRIDFLSTVRYEAIRAGLDPEMVLGLIEVESGFKKYAVSSVAARGYMQVMPFWVKVVGTPDQDLFHLRTNLRYGCNILRLYLDMEKGDLYRALGRYNGSLGKPEYPTMVVSAWKRHWSYTPNTQTVQASVVKVAGN